MWGVVAYFATLWVAALLIIGLCKAGRSDKD